MRRQIISWYNSFIKNLEYIGGGARHWYDKLTGKEKYKLEDTPAFPRLRRTTREINVGLEAKLERYMAEVKLKHQRPDITDVEKVPYKKHRDRKAQWRAIRLLTYSARQNFPREYTLQMFDAYRKLDKSFEGKQYGFHLLSKLMPEVDHGKLSVEQAYFLTKYIQVLGARSRAGTKAYFLEGFLRTDYKLNNKKLVDRAQRRVEIYRRYVAELEPQERQVIAVRDRLWDKEWEPYLESLIKKSENPPDVAHITSIEVDINAIKRLKDYEKKQGVNLADFLPPSDPPQL